MAPAALTPRETAVRNAIADHVRRTGFPPTRDELRAVMGWKSASTVQYFVGRLREKGALEIIDGAARGLRLAGPPRPASAIPILGRIIAGAALGGDKDVDKDVEASIPAAAAGALFRWRPDYFLRVRDDSMRGAGIDDGDLVAVREAEDARDGQIVVACVDGEATVRRLQRGNGHVTLVAESPDRDAIPVECDGFEIRGIVVGSLRDRGEA